MSWVQRAADQGLAEACFTLGAICDQGLEAPHEGGGGGCEAAGRRGGVVYLRQPSAEAAATWYRRAADQGHTRAQV